MMFELVFSEKAASIFLDLRKSKSKQNQYKAVGKVLGFMKLNLRHPSLNTHKFIGLTCEFGDVFETYAQNHTPGAYRIFWSYGPGKNQIYILNIAKHS